ncbi:MAG: ABC transporter permease [Phocaeicola coprocola]
MRRVDFDTWEEILLTITRNKTRSVLTAFGIFWGIFMLVALMGGAQGMQDMLSRQFQGFATNSGFMATNKRPRSPTKGFSAGKRLEHGKSGCGTHTRNCIARHRCEI